MSKNVDLNRAKIVNGEGPNRKLIDNSIRDINANVSIIFRGHKELLLQKISQYNYIVGCIAWLTDFEIIKAFSKVEHISIIVQKEDFLRSDLNAGNSWKNDLRKAYNGLSVFFRLDGYGGLLSELSYMLDTGNNAAIRCIGNYNRDKKPAFPRMHNKFLVFSNYIEGKQIGDNFIEPIINYQEVWTGSYNLTKNAENSLENVVLIKNNKIAEAYYNEFCQIFALSEPLDWETDWSEPEFKIGS